MNMNPEKKNATLPSIVLRAINIIRSIERLIDEKQALSHYAS